VLRRYNSFKHGLGRYAQVVTPEEIFAYNKKILDKVRANRSEPYIPYWGAADAFYDEILTKAKKPLSSQKIDKVLGSGSFQLAMRMEDGSVLKIGEPERTGPGMRREQDRLFEGTGKRHSPAVYEVGEAHTQMASYMPFKAYLADLKEGNKYFPKKSENTYLADAMRFFVSGCYENLRAFEVFVNAGYLVLKGEKTPDVTDEEYTKPSDFSTWARRLAPEERASYLVDLLHAKDVYVTLNEVGLRGLKSKNFEVKYVISYDPDKHTILFDDLAEALNGFKPMTLVNEVAESEVPDSRKDFFNKFRAKYLEVAEGYLLRGFWDLHDGNLGIEHTRESVLFFEPPELVFFDL